MFRFAQFTIYEIVGYLLPGAVFVAAAGLFAWTIQAPNVELPVFSPSFDLWALLIAVSYYAGHAVQGIANYTLDNNSAIGGKLLRISSRVSAAIRVRLRLSAKVTPELPP